MFFGIKIAFSRQILDRIASNSNCRSMIPWRSLWCRSECCRVVLLLNIFIDKKIVFSTFHPARAFFIVKVSLMFPLKYSSLKFGQVFSEAWSQLIDNYWSYLELNISLYWRETPLKTARVRIGFARSDRKVGVARLYRLLFNLMILS